MPIYEFKCKKCDNIFESLHIKSDDRHSPCPSCGEEKTERLLSTFSSVSSSSSQGLGGTAAPPSCRPSGGFS